ATAVNNGSTAGCGPLTLQVQKQGVVYGQIVEGGTLTLTAPSGTVFTAVDFASYGTPTGTNGNYALGGCHAGNSASIVGTYLLGKNSASIPATNGVFGDPCLNTYKALAVRATYATPTPAAQLTYSCAEVGTSTILLTVTDANGNTSTTKATVTVQDNLAPTVVAQDVNLTLDATGMATLTTAQVNNGSFDNCGIASMSVSPSTFSCGNLSGPNRYAVNLDGVDDYLSLPSNLLSTNRSFTFETWLNYQDNGNWTRLFDFSSSTNTYLLLTPKANWDANSLNKLAFAISTGGNPGEQRIVANTTMPTGWHHVAFTLAWNTSTNRGTGTIYLDGTAVGSNSALTLNPSLLGTLTNYWLGRSIYGQDPYLKGQLDEVRIWSVARTAAEIAATKDRTLVGNEANLLAYLPLENGPGSVTATDASGHSNSGTLLNSSPSTAWVTTPSAAAPTGTVPVTLTATDANGNSSTATATVTLQQPSVNSIPSLTWTGATSTDWSDCGNWSYGMVPSASHNVTIPAGLSRYPILSAGTATMTNLTIVSGASVTLASGATLQATGNVDEQGPALGGTVRLIGTGAQTVAGSFSTLVVNKASGTTTLSGNVNVATALTLTSGTLNTGNYTVELGSAAALTESATNYLTGTVKTTRDVSTAGTRYSFESLGLALTPTGSTLPGTTTVRRVTGTALTGQGTSSSIKRYYDIQAATNSNLNVTLEFGYFDTELNTIPEAQLTLFRSSTGTTG
ncbi:LamG-like jellyroll fold domain-containing protein, partial [Hymenobacter crusticola]